MLWTLILYLYAGLVMAEVGIMHMNGSPLTVRAKIGYITVILFWAVHFPYYILKQRRK